MSLPKQIARLSIGTVNSALDAVRLAIWVPLGLLLFFGIAGVVFAPILKHLATYWWVYLLAIAASVGFIWYLLFDGTSHVGQPAPGGSQPSRSRSPAHQAMSQEEQVIDKNLSTTGRPTSGLALFRFTEEWIARNGLYDGRTISKADAVEIAGSTAISYHIRKGNFLQRDGRIALTAKGKAHFEKRRSRLQIGVTTLKKLISSEFTQIQIIENIETQLPWDPSVGTLIAD